MKTTIELADDLFVAVKRRAAEERTTIRTLVERGLRQQLAARPSPPKAAGIRWVTVKGGLPRGVDISSRETMHESLRRSR